MSHFYLPPLKDDHNVPMPDEAGVWFPTTDRSLLFSLSDGLEISTDSVVRGINSIPDVWARPRLFKDALFNDAHPLHSRILEEWRGLLSLLALRKIHTYPVSFRTVDLRDFVEGEKEGNGPTPKIVTSLNRMKPSPVRLEDDKEYSWDQVVLIYYAELPVGAFCPNTLVYTGADYHRSLKDKDLVLQQIDGKTKSGYLGLPETLEERKYVGVWVDRLLKQLKPLLNTREDHPDHMVTDQINDLLQQWRKVLPSAETVTAVAVSDRPTEVKGMPSEFSVYQALLYPLVESEADDHTLSEVYLMESYLRDTSPSQRVVVVNKELLEKNKRVWKLKTLRQLGGNSEHALEEYFDGASGELIDEENIHEAANAIWIRPERFFLTNNLIKAANGQPLLTMTEKRLNGGVDRFVLPFRREILQYFDPDRIEEALNPRFEPVSGGVKFIFDLYIGNEKTGTDKIEVEKTYLEKAEGKAGTIKEVEVPVLDLFPNYPADFWRKYYLLQSSASGLVGSPVFGTKGGSTTKREYSAILDDTRYSVAITEIAGEGSFPEGIEIREQAIPGESEPVGVVLLAKPERKGAGLRGQWIVGIDFGTSNTNVFRLEEVHANPIPWEMDLGEHLRSITASDPIVRTEILERFFFPAKKIEFPIPTGLRVLNRGETQKKILLDTNIYIPDGRFNVADNVRTNIKWDEAWLSYHYFEILLYLLLIGATAKEVEKIEFRFAYPKVKVGGKQKMATYWQKALGDLTSGDERALDVWQGAGDQQKPKVEIGPGFSEGRAAGEYFGSKKSVGSSSHAKLGNAAICLDVGGATTDLSVWIEDYIVADESVLLAGMNVSDYLRRRKFLIEYLFSPVAAKTLHAVRESPVQFAAALNLILRNPEEESQVHENLLQRSSEGDIQRLRQILVLEFGAVIYYSGLVLEAVANKMRPEVLNIVSQHGLTFHWGGNASKLLSWLDYGHMSTDSTGSQLLNRIFRSTPVHKGLRDDYLLKQHQSPGHKDEVAGGLVIIERGDGSEPRVGRSFVSGEVIKLKGGREISHDTFIGEGDLFRESEVLFEETSLALFEDFVGVVNRVGIEIGLLEERQKIELTDHLKASIGGSIRSTFVRSANQKSEDRNLEPIFIMEVKDLLGLLSEG